MEAKLAYLLDRTTEFGEDRARTLDTLTEAIKTSSAESKEALEVWRILKEDHYFWFNSDRVLQLSQVDDTKVFMLVILEDAIKQKWYALPEGQREAIKSYIVNLVLQYGAMENLSKSLHNILSKANSTLVQIVKYEWNTTWKSFISDICSASVKDMNICENNFYVLKMLSEEIFDYSKNQMTQAQITDLKAQMNNEFTTIFELCRLVLENMHQAKQSLLKACLETLNAFLSWIPMYYIIYTDLIDKLIMLLASDYLRNFALSCLVQIACLKPEEQNEVEKHKYLSMLRSVTNELHKLIPLTNDNNQIHVMLASIRKRNRNIFEILARGIANFYSEFFRNQHSWLSQTVLGNEEFVEICHFGFRYLLMMMRIDQDQVFKITVEFFHYYIDHYLKGHNELQSARALGGNSLMLASSISLQSLYPDVFHEVIKILTLKMAKPEQVLIQIDEDGFPVKQEMEDTENSSLYEAEKELAMNLVRYDWPFMKGFILTEIEKQHQPELFSFAILNSLSWIIGSLCGAMQEREEKSFFISCLKTLLQLCESKKGKDNKAVIASCIMYVVGQYPTFLRSNWTFLKTVVKKLFEFMKEQFPGIMEMACNAFLKISKSTADQFVQVQLNQHEPYVREIIRRIPEFIKKLNGDMLQLVFYESVGYLMGAQEDASTQLQMMKQTLGMHLFEYQSIINMAQSNQNLLKEEEIQRKLIFFLKINETIAVGIGRNYTNMLQILCETFNKLYLFYSGEVNAAVATNKAMLNYVTVRIMRAIKKEIIRVYIRLLEKCNDLTPMLSERILVQFVFPLGPLLKDFHQCTPETKEQEFVALFTLVLEKLYVSIDAQFLQKLIEMVFSSSLPLITSDFNSFPEIRANFFAFLKALIKFNFGLLFSLKQDHFSTILNCIIWSFRHQLSTYSDLGLQQLQEVLSNVNKNTQIANIFYQKYHMKILTQILDVMTDGFHESGRDLQAKILFILIHVTTQHIVLDSISAEQQPNQANDQFLYGFLVDRLSGAFNNVSRQATAQKVASWFKQFDEKMFKDEIADYLIMINRYSIQDVSENGKTPS